MKSACKIAIILMIYLMMGIIVTFLFTTAVKFAVDGKTIAFIGTAIVFAIVFTISLVTAASTDKINAFLEKKRHKKADN